jgi:hypothetical protein
MMVSRNGGHRPRRWKETASLEDDEDSVAVPPTLEGEGGSRLWLVLESQLRANAP